GLLPDLACQALLRRLARLELASQPVVLAGLVAVTLGPPQHERTLAVPDVGQRAQLDPHPQPSSAAVRRRLETAATNRASKVGSSHVLPALSMRSRGRLVNPAPCCSK